MKRPALIASALAVLAVVPADAEPPEEMLGTWREVTFTAPLQCSFVCPYWVETFNHDADGDGTQDIAFSTCGNPAGTGGTLGDAPRAFERGTIYDDVVVGPTPVGARLLVFDSFPAMDWDTFICSMDGQELASGANLLDPDSCSGLLGPGNPVPTGCSEKATISAEPWARYILRAYNWSDPLPLEARYCFSSEGHCEEE